MKSESYVFYIFRVEVVARKAIMKDGGHFFNVLSFGFVVCRFCVWH